jgi:hypothetical protein
MAAWYAGVPQWWLCTCSECVVLCTSMQELDHCWPRPSKRYLIMSNEYYRVSGYLDCQ